MQASPAGFLWNLCSVVCKLVLLVTLRNHMLHANRPRMPRNWWGVFPNSHLHTHKLVQGIFREHLCTSGLIGGADLPAKMALVLEVSFQEWTGRSWSFSFV